VGRQSRGRTPSDRWGVSSESEASYERIEELVSWLATSAPGPKGNIELLVESCS
jgi:hypothetical protein